MQQILNKLLMISILAQFPHNLTRLRSVYLVTNDARIDLIEQLLPPGFFLLRRPAHLVRGKHTLHIDPPDFLPQLLVCPLHNQHFALVRIDQTLQFRQLILKSHDSLFRFSQLVVKQLNCPNRLLNIRCQLQNPKILFSLSNQNLHVFPLVHPGRSWLEGRHRRYQIYGLSRPMSLRRDPQLTLIGNTELAHVPAGPSGPTRFITCRNFIPLLLLARQERTPLRHHLVTAGRTESTRVA